MNPGNYVIAGILVNHIYTCPIAGTLATAIKVAIPLILYQVTDTVNFYIITLAAKHGWKGVVFVLYVSVCLQNLWKTVNIDG